MKKINEADILDEISELENSKKETKKRAGLIVHPALFFDVLSVMIHLF